MSGAPASTMTVSGLEAEELFLVQAEIIMVANNNINSFFITSYSLSWLSVESMEIA